MTEKSYKPEIDGLRAIAVISVLLYHIEPDILPSGFIGVDIFLVISGYLITRIIIKSRVEHDFFLYSFYMKRVKRILPLTYCVIIFILFTGWFLSYPTLYRAEANSTLSALYFVANLRFATMGNYFSPSNDNPLLHLWSLSLEEQFYFIWPLIIVVLYKANEERRLFFFCIILSILSAFFSIAISNIDSVAQYAYFALPTRMTGLLFGAGLATINTNSVKRINKSNIVAITGIILTVYSLLFIDEKYFPGPSLMVPCVGVALIIISPNAKITKVLLTNKIITFIGKISFSLYIWHWPLLVFGRRIVENNYYPLNDTLGLFFYCLILFSLSIFSYIFIESLFRNLKLTNHTTLGIFFIFPLVLLTATSLYISKSNGVPSRYGLTDKMTRIETLNCYASLTDKPCYLTSQKEGPNYLLLIGDSHAGAMGHFVRRLSEATGFSALDSSSGGCAFFSDRFKSAGCENVKSKISRALKEKPVKHVVIAKRYDGMEINDVESLLSYAIHLERLGYSVIMIKQIPLLSEKYKDKKFMSSYLRGELSESTFDIDVNFKKYSNLLEDLANEYDNITLLDFEQHLLNSDGSYTLLDEKGYPLYYDEDHLSAYGAEWLFIRYRKSPEWIVLQDFLRSKM